MSYAVETGPGRVSFLLVETALSPEIALGALVRASIAGRENLRVSPAEAVERAIAAEPGCSVAAARWEGDRVTLAASPGAEIPYLLRDARPVPFPVSERTTPARK